jgi:hypothetical protein
MTEVIKKRLPRTCNVIAATELLSFFRVHPTFNSSLKGLIFKRQMGQQCLIKYAPFISEKENNVLK